MIFWLTLTALASSVATLGFIYFVGALKSTREVSVGDRREKPLFFEIWDFSTQKSAKKRNFPKIP